ncbi:2-amino-4-hydroxy-6-hydroxymethyldihydropteridine diphosphokinase [Frigidibacter oleivorans]|uniref:2-amino-4-hydroxy-6- hydroxymethyldihydropteridine diphosphokinase n=1 Tax=Frigidibacter oleivorans TaxID=2487129 RepID=UPI000F8D29D2|nr:2-amino-4-hydroxy-6-hydroxymethyldihydropteridine diphosphokinase [Frigidibacter oleivorans]
MVTFPYLALGANLPTGMQSADETLRRAIAQLETERFHIRDIGRFFHTPAFPQGSGPDYVNAAARAETDLPAEAVLAHLHAVEARLGRERTGRWAARTVDIDLLAIGDSILPDGAEQARWRTLPPGRQHIETPDRLILPHPRITERAFVLVPLADIAPLWQDPVTGRRLPDLLAALDPAEVAAVRPI